MAKTQTCLEIACQPADDEHTQRAAFSIHKIIIIKTASKLLLLCAAVESLL